MKQFKHIFIAIAFSLTSFTLAHSQDLTGKNLRAAESNMTNEKALVKIPSPLVFKNDIITSKTEDKLVYAISCWQKGILIYQGVGLDPNVQVRDSITMMQPHSSSTISNQSLSLINMGETFCVISKK